LSLFLKDKRGFEMDGLETEFWRSAAFIAAILWQSLIWRPFGRI
jgi:hypothetical protein